MKRAIFAIICMTASFHLAAQAGDKTIAVLEVTGEGVSDAESSLVHEYIVDRMNRNKTYTLVERAALNRALKELELSSTDIVDETTAARIGKIAGARYILLTSLIKRNDEYHLSMRVVNVETSRIENTAIEKTSDFSTIDTLTRTAVVRLFNLSFDEIDAREAFLNLSAGGGLAIPVADVRRVLSLGYNGLVGVSYDMKLGPGWLGFGITTGGVFEPTLPKDDPESEVVYEYTLVAIPAFGAVTYRVLVGSFYFGAEVNAGVLLSFAMLGDAGAGDPGFSAVPSFTGGIYGGYAFTETIGVSVGADYIHALYTGAPYTGLVVIARTDIGL
jgi:hypothetical protein